MKNNYLGKILILLVTLLLPARTYALDGNPGSRNNWNNNVSYNGRTNFTINLTEDGKTYSSATGGEIALLVSGGVSTINNATISKTGDSSGDDADFYGTNAALLTYNNAALTMRRGTINTNGLHANGAFAYGTGMITLNEVNITTSSSNSGGLMVAGGGRIVASNVNVKTSGNSSAAIRSDKGGGNIAVSNGTYETTGAGSPAIYSTAYIVVNGAKLVSNNSEGVIVEGDNSAIINNVTLTDTNTNLYGNSDTHKNIFLYNSTASDNNTGNGEFVANKSKVVTNKGDTIFVTNTRTTITLNDNTFVNNDKGAFLRIQKSRWGTAGNNGGIVTLNLSKQAINGDIIVDDISTLDIYMKENSAIYGAIDSAKQAKLINLTMSENSILSLTGDSYINSLTNDDETNSNIYLNGYKLYVNGTSVKGNTKVIKKNDDTQTTTTTGTTTSAPTARKKSNAGIYYVILILVILAIAIPAYIFFKRRGDDSY